MAKRTIEQQIADLQAKQTAAMRKTKLRALAESVRSHVIAGDEQIALVDLEELRMMLHDTKPKAKP